VKLDIHIRALAAAAQTIAWKAHDLDDLVIQSGGREGLDFDAQIRYLLTEGGLTTGDVLNYMIDAAFYGIEEPAPQGPRQEGDYRLYRNIIRFEVLTDDGPLSDDQSLRAIYDETIDGGWSGKWDVVLRQPLTEAQMAEALTAQGSDPSFFNLDIPDLPVVTRAEFEAIVTAGAAEHAAATGEAAYQTSDVAQAWAATAEHDGQTRYARVLVETVFDLAPEFAEAAIEQLDADRAVALFKRWGELSWNDTVYEFMEDHQ
jgi:hypothetical protein